MNSYRQIIYHIVFCTYNPENTLPSEQHEVLYKYIWGIIKKRKGLLYRINGTENHIHILSDLHPTVSLSEFVKDIKTGTNFMMRESGDFPNFTSWAEGSCALTYSMKEKDKLISYIKNQKEHHKKHSFEDEYRSLLNEHGIEWDERYIF